MRPIGLGDLPIDRALRGWWGAAHPDPVALSRGQHAELVAIGIDQHHPADLALADVDPSRPEGDQTVDLRLLIPGDRWSEVEVQPVLPRLRRHGGTAPG